MRILGIANGNRSLREKRGVFVSYCDFDDAPSFMAESFQKAKKPHTCCECGAKIQPGEIYVTCKGVWHGEFNTHKQHMICRELCMEIRDERGECLCFGELFDYVNDAGRFAFEDKRQRVLLARATWLREKGRYPSFLPPITDFRESEL